MAHPRRVYYFLTATPRQQIPEFSDNPYTAKRILSPATSSGPDEEEEQGSRKRKEMSPSPDVDLLSSEAEISHAHAIAELSFPNNDFSEQQDSSLHSRRAASPPLESDEREFTQTASVMQQRKQSEQAEQQQQELARSRSASISVLDPTMGENSLIELTVDAVEDESEESAALRNQEAAAALFGHDGRHLLHLTDFNASSPWLRPQRELHVVTTPRKTSAVLDRLDLHVHLSKDHDMGMFDAFDTWGELQSPEDVELSELDDLLGSF